MAMKTPSQPELKPGALLILPVLVSEFFFQHFGFLAGANDLHRYQNYEDEKQIRLLHHQQEAKNEQLAEQIYGIADFRINAVSNKVSGLRRD